MKEKVDSSSPIGVLEDYFCSSESESTCSRDSQPPSYFSGLFKFLRKNSKKSADKLQTSSVFKLSRRLSNSMRESLGLSFPLDDNLCHFNSPWKNFSLQELHSATHYFSHENLIGKGGYSEVYKGCLSNKQLVAIKRLTRGNPDEIVADFLQEVGIMAHLDHPNIAKLIGYGVEGGMHLVLELSPRGSLASMLYGSKEKLRWENRYKIAIGTAKGLLYLHQSCQRRIIHRDIKAANILLSHNFEPQICDFGLAKWLPEQWTHHIVSKFEGTFGYLAPEYLLNGIVDERTDIFAFGVLLLELVTGRRALDYSKQSLVLWAKPLLKKNAITELIDPYIMSDYNSREMNFVLLVASLCIQHSPIRRPRANQVVQLLSGDLGYIKCMNKTRIPFLRKTVREELARDRVV